MQKRYDYCPNCLQGTEEHVNICSGCGFDLIGYEEKEHLIKPCTMLKERYMTGRVIGEGGFGVTYKGWDTMLQTFVAIKEYFPQFMAHRSIENTQITPTTAKKETYEKGLKRYLDEARNLSKFYQLSGIVSVKDFFYENGTGYIVMEYIDGVNLKQYLGENGGKIPEAKVRTLVKPVLESLMEIHDAGLIHRDISPDNVMVDKKNRIKLIDFGSVRDQSTGDEKTYTVTLKHGYAPPEQYYAKGKQGTWTDIYSICATMYRMLTGNNPPNSIERLTKDEYVSPSYYGVNVSPKMEAVLYKGLSVNYEERYQNIKELMDDLYLGKVTQQPIVQQSVSQTVVAQPIMHQSAMVQQGMNLQPAINQQIPQQAYQQIYKSQNVSTQQYPQTEKSKLWIPILIVVIALAIIAAVVVPKVIDANKVKDDDTEEMFNDTEEVIVSTEEVINEINAIYSQYGISVTLPFGYAYDAENSDEEFYFYTKGNGNIFMIFSGETEGTPENNLVDVIEQTLVDSYQTEWVKATASYNGVSCAEFTGTVVESGITFDATAAFCYLEDMYLVVMYMPFDGEYADYYEAMETVTYE